MAFFQEGHGTRFGAFPRSKSNLEKQPMTQQDSQQKPLPLVTLYNLVPVMLGGGVWNLHQLFPKVGTVSQDDVRCLHHPLRGEQGWPLLCVAHSLLPGLVRLHSHGRNRTTSRILAARICTMLFLPRLFVFCISAKEEGIKESGIQNEHLPDFPSPRGTLGYLT